MSVIEQRRENLWHGAARCGGIGRAHGPGARGVGLSRAPAFSISLNAPQILAIVRARPGASRLAWR